MEKQKYCLGSECAYFDEDDIINNRCTGWCALSKKHLKRSELNDIYYEPCKACAPFSRSEKFRQDGLQIHGQAVYYHPEYRKWLEDKEKAKIRNNPAIIYYAKDYQEWLQRKAKQQED